MLKLKLIVLAVKIIMGAIALGLGIWYLSSSIGGEALTYTSMDNFLTAVGVENGDITSANGCFMCGYIADLFVVIGDAAMRFWGMLVDNIWIIMVIGFGIFLFIYTAQYIFEAAKTTTKLDGEEKKIDFKPWFDKVWKQAARLLVVGGLMGMLGLGGTTAMKTVSNITITPVLYLGAELGMAATGVSDAAQYGALNPTNQNDAGDVLNPIMQPFMCVIGNINSVMLAGAAGGFAMMNYAWMGLGGGAFTWAAGLMLVLMFLVIGFDLFFQILTVVMKLIFIIIFLPLIMAASAFEATWSKAQNLLGNCVEILFSSAIKLVAITLKAIIVFATVSYAADAYFPGPVDGFNAILPPMMGRTVENPDAQTLSVMNVFSTCEKVALVNGEMDGDKFQDCFTARKAEVERKYPDAFKFLDDGWDFFLMMIGLFFLYYYAVAPKVDAIISKAYSYEVLKEFDFGGNIKRLGQNIWNAPAKITEALGSRIGKS
ncbi:MAG: hypothetical protein R8M37_03445 [Alphaproteobacteria bacterium]|nr:hypothetical protein [Alphaproteobacteria bacterium]